MNNYKKELNKTKYEKTKIKIKNDTIEHKWTKHMFNLKTNNENKTEWQKPSNNNFITQINDSSLFADDATIDIKDINNTKSKLIAYDKTTTKNDLSINWKKVNILCKNKDNINISDEPYNKINFVEKAKLLGHMMSADNKMDTAVTDRIQKATQSWAAIKKNKILHKDVNSKLKIRLYNSLIQTVLLYSLQIIPLNAKNTNKLQKFQSKIIRNILNKNYNLNQPNEKLPTNTEISQNYNIPTIQSTLEKLRMQMYLNWRNTLSFTYLNNEDYINNELNNLKLYITKIKNFLTNNLIHENIKYLNKYTYFNSLKYINKQTIIQKIQNINEIQYSVVKTRMI